MDKWHILSPENLSNFLNDIALGHKDAIDFSDLEIFVNLIPTELEVLRFKERLSSYSIDSFLSLQLLGSPSFSFK